MSEKQQLMWLKAFRSIADGQVRDHLRRQNSAQALEDIGYVRHINCAADALLPDARAIYDKGRAETPEEHAIIRPFLKEVRIKRAEFVTRGKSWERVGGSKEAQRAAKRLAKKESVHES